MDESRKTRYGELRVRDTGGRGPVVLTTPDGPNVLEHLDPMFPDLEQPQRYAEAALAALNA